MYNKIIRINDKIRDEKLTGDKYEYLTGEEIIPSNQKQTIEQAKFTYPLLGKAFQKQIKTIEDHGKKTN